MAAYGNDGGPIPLQSYPPHYDPYQSQLRQQASTTSLDSDEEHDQTPLAKEMRKGGDVTVRMNYPDGTRTPSPTPSETAELAKTGLINWQKAKDWHFWIRREWLWYYIFGVLGAIVIILFAAFHDQIVTFLQPAATWMHNLPAGWLIPIGIMFVISFPPLFGHEIIALLCGLVWGLAEGFAIVAAGTLIGELGNFFAFKLCCAARGEKYEREQISYACLAKIVREGGFKIALIARFSAVPGHLTTAVFSTCGMSVWTFLLAAIFSLPKQLVTVYLGVALEESQSGSSSSTKQNIIKDVVLVITLISTFVAMHYIRKKMEEAKPRVIYDRRKARQAKILQASWDRSYMPTADASASAVTLLPPAADMHQQWDASGRAVGYIADPSLHTPTPRRPTFQQEPIAAPRPVPAHTPSLPLANPYPEPQSPAHQHQSSLPNPYSSMPSSAPPAPRYPEPDGDVGHAFEQAFPDPHPHGPPMQTYLQSASIEPPSYSSWPPSAQQPESSPYAYQSNSGYR